MICAILKRGRCREFRGSKSASARGFAAGLWNGLSGGDEVGLSVVCGVASPDVGNFVSLYLPEQLGDLRERERMRAF